MFDLLSQPWPWYISGTTIASIMVLLLFLGKSFGVSSNLRTICTMAGAGKKLSFFDFDWRTQKWNLLFLIGSLIGGFFASTILKDPKPLQLASETISDLKKIGISFNGELNPEQIYGLNSITSLHQILILLFGGMLVGFGARYAGGCTSGHAISGLSNLQLPSLIAVVGFFAGGLVMTHILLPILF